MIKIIKVYRDSRVLENGTLKTLGLAVKTDDNFDMLRFQFDEMINGVGTLLTDLTDDNNEMVAFPLTRNLEENSYDLVITKYLASQLSITLQLEVVHDDFVWHSKQATLKLDDCLEVGTGEMPTTIENWLQNANLVMSGYQDKVDEWQVQVDKMQDDIDEAISDCETATSGAEKVDISQEKENHIITITTTNRNGIETEETIQEPLVSVEKEGKETTITAVDSEGTTSAVVKDGADFEYNWEGTSLGVKNSDESEYQYVNLKGDRGDANFPVLDINNQAHLIMYSETDLQNINFSLNANGHLIESLEV